MAQKKQISKFGQTFISYGSYHYDSVNKIIHIFCIPIITATLLAGLSYIPYRMQIYNYDVGFQHLFCLFAMLFYLIAVGVPACALMGVLLWGGAELWKLGFSGSSSTEMRNYIIGLHIVAWILQFVGHGVFQKRKPALLDNISQIFSAPLFVAIQLFDLVGVRTQEMQIWKKQIKKNVEEFRAANKIKK